MVISKKCRKAGQLPHCLLLGDIALHVENWRRNTPGRADHTHVRKTTSGGIDSRQTLPGKFKIEAAQTEHGKELSRRTLFDDALSVVGHSPQLKGTGLKEKTMCSGESTLFCQTSQRYLQPQRGCSAHRYSSSSTKGASWAGPHQPY